MNHPAPETWIAYVYGELASSSSDEAEAHLRDCPQCQQAVERLRATMTALNQDGALLALPRRRPAIPAWALPVRLGLAASVVLVAGFLAGRLTGASQADIQRQVLAARQSMEAQFRDEIKAVAVAAIATSAEENRRLVTEVAHNLQIARKADRQDLSAALDALNQRRALDSETLREALVTLARRTGTGFQQTDSQLNLLASYLPAEPNTSSLSHSTTDK